jgi:hypothetical protein
MYVNDRIYILMLILSFIGLINIIFDLIKGVIWILKLKIF